MTSLLTAAATAVQRIYRGYLARRFTVEKRTEMAQFIALMRVQEAQQDEEIYWQTHPWSRFKRNRREWYVVPCVTTPEHGIAIINRTEHRQNTAYVIILVLFHYFPSLPVHCN